MGRAELLLWVMVMVRDAMGVRDDGSGPLPSPALAGDFAKVRDLTSETTTKNGWVKVRNIVRLRRMHGLAEFR